MAKSQNSFIKAQKEKKRAQKRKEKEEKKQERKENNLKGGDMTDMMAYVDKYGNVVSGTLAEITAAKEAEAAEAAAKAKRRRDDRS